MIRYAASAYTIPRIEDDRKTDGREDRCHLITEISEQSEVQPEFRYVLKVVIVRFKIRIRTFRNCRHFLFAWS